MEICRAFCHRFGGARMNKCDLIQIFDRVSDLIAKAAVLTNSAACCPIACTPRIFLDSASTRILNITWTGSKMLFSSSVTSDRLGVSDRAKSGASRLLLLSSPRRQSVDQYVHTGVFMFEQNGFSFQESRRPLPAPEQPPYCPSSRAH